MAVQSSAATLADVERLLRMDRFSQALTLLERLPSGQIDAAEIEALRAASLVGLARFDEATDAARGALQIDPANVRAHYVIGLAAQINDQPRQALDAYNAALNLDPTFALALYGRGMVLLAAGHRDAAAVDLRRAQQFYPDSWRLAAGIAMLEQGRARPRALRAAYRQGLAEGVGPIRLRLRVVGTYLAEAIAPLFGNTPALSPQLSIEAYRTLQARPVFIVYLLLAINVLMYVLLEIHGGSQNNETLYQFGAKYNPAIVHGGQWWRFITPIFLHAGIVHLVVNGSSLYFVGVLYERCVGPARFLYVYMFAGIGGSLFSFAASNDLAVGASGAIFGIFGALGLYFYRNRALFGRIARSLVGQIAALSVLNLLLPNLVAGIDGWAHLGGLVTGIIAGYLVGPQLDTRTLHGNLQEILVDRRLAPRVIVMLVAAAVILGLVCAGVIYWNPTGA